MNEFICQAQSQCKDNKKSVTETERRRKLFLHPSQPGQLSLAIPSSAMMTSQMAVALLLGRQGDKVWAVCGWQVKLCDPIVTHGPCLTSVVAVLYVTACCWLSYLSGCLNCDEEDYYYYYYITIITKKTYQHTNTKLSG